MDNELQHYGVLGMKWGKHKREESVNVQNARQSLKEQNINLRKEKHIYNKATAYGYIGPTTAVQKRLDGAKREHRYAKEDLASAKILDNVNSKPKSKSQLKLEAKYKAQGMTNDEATVAAYKNIKTKKIIAAAGATVVVAGGAYLAYKYHDERVDKIIKSGTKLSNISTDNSKDIRDQFYSTKVADKGKIFDKLDNAKYKGIFARNISNMGDGAYDKEIHTLKDIRMVSPENSRKAIASLVKNDPDYHEKLKSYILYQSGDYVDSWPGLDKIRKRAVNDIVDGKVTKDVAKIVNMALVDHSSRGDSVTQPFINSLKNNGYNAIRDVTDKELSGFKTFNPIITFASKGLVDVVDVKQLTEETIKSSEKLAYGHIYSDMGTKLGGQVAALTLAVNGTSKLVSNKQDRALTKAASTYQESHPDTKMTITEIKRMLERSS